MYVNFNFTQTNNVLILLIISLLPLSLTFYAFYDKTLKKLCVAVYLFNFIKVFSGYITNRKLGGFYIHNKNKAIILKPKLKSFKGNNAIIKALSLKTIIINAYLGVDNLPALFSVLTVKNSLNTIFTTVNGNKFRVNYDFNLFLSVNSGLSFGVKTIIKTCVLRILLAVIAKSIKKGIKN